MRAPIDLPMPEMADRESSSWTAESELRSRLNRKSVAMVVFSSYPEDPRPRRAIDALLGMGMRVDLLCEAKGSSPRRMVDGGLRITRIPVRHHRGGACSYLYQYFAFTALATLILLFRSLERRYDLVYVHNMPDVLVFSAVFPRLLGAKVVLDQHDPMPELMTALFGLSQKSVVLRLIRMAEKLSLGFADRVITVNLRCKAIFSERSCRASKIDVVMNTPDEAIFPFRPVASYVRGGEPDRPFVMMFHGSLVERNGLGLAVKALAIVRRTVPNAVLDVYGASTPYLERVLEEARALGVEGAVEYRGAKTLEQLVEEIQGSDVGIIPNERNTFTWINTPTRLFEYLILGRPVIAPDTPGIRDYFPSRTLHYFEAGSAEGLAAKMLEVYSNPDEAAQVAARGQEICLEHAWCKERERLLLLVANLLDGCQGVATACPLEGSI